MGDDYVLTWADDNGPNVERFGFENGALCLLAFLSGFRPEAEVLILHCGREVRL